MVGFSLLAKNDASLPQSFSALRYLLGLTTFSVRWFIHLLFVMELTQCG